MCCAHKHICFVSCAYVYKNTCARVCVCVCDTFKVPEAKPSTAFLTSCMVLLKLPKPERWPWAGKYCQEAQEAHNQASLRTQFNSHWQLITVRFLIPAQQNNPPKPCDPLGQAQKLQSSLILHQHVHIEKLCLGELWIVLPCLWSNICGLIFQANTITFQKRIFPQCLSQRTQY